MDVSPKTKAILLLTTHFPKVQSGAAKPLTPGEWGRFAKWLKSHSLTPEGLFKEDPDVLLQGWQDKTVSVDRIKVLLERGMDLSWYMDKWSRGGLWIMTRSDSDYPARLKQRLGINSPAVFFGCGRRALLGDGGVAVVGSRNAGQSDLECSRKFGASVSQSGRSVISGGARGVDEAVTLAALEAEGTAIGVMADNLLRACTSAKYRRYLTGHNLVLISPFNPEAGFNVGNAMQRNKYIYCLSDLALVVHSGKQGGTWSGATENLKRKWVPLLVKNTSDPEAGNADLIKKGAIEIAVSAVSDAADDISSSVGSPQPDFYHFFLSKVEQACSDEPQTAANLAKHFQVKKTQLDDWLKRAVSEGRIKKFRNPVRYQWTGQNTIFK